MGAYYRYSIRCIIFGDPYCNYCRFNEEQKSQEIKSSKVLTHKKIIDVLRKSKQEKAPKETDPVVEEPDNNKWQTICIELQKFTSDIK